MAAQVALNIVPFVGPVVSQALSLYASERGGYSGSHITSTFPPAPLRRGKAGCVRATNQVSAGMHFGTGALAGLSRYLVRGLGQQWPSPIDAVVIHLKMAARHGAMLGVALPRVCVVRLFHPYQGRWRRWPRFGLLGRPFASLPTIPGAPARGASEAARWDGASPRCPKKS